LLTLDLSEAADNDGGLCRLLETVLKEVRLNEQKKLAGQARVLGD
jgi:hypothetical protein